MSPENFVYWLQGRAELLPDQPPTAEEWKMIREHLALVFQKVTPPLGHTVWPRSPSLVPGPMDELPLPLRPMCSAGGHPSYHRLSDIAQRIMHDGGVNGITC